MNLLKCLLIIVTFPFLSIKSKQLRAISIYGLETELRDFVCSWQHPVDFYIQQVYGMGFNSLRLPFSVQYYNEGDFSKMDHFIDVAEQYNMEVVLDLHRVVSSWQGPDPFHDLGMNIDKLVDLWLNVLRRYKDRPHVIGSNVYNEYTGTDVDFLLWYSKKVIDAVELEFGDRYKHYITGTSWSGNLSGVYLKNVSYSDRVFYSCHKYAFSGTADEKDWNASIPFGYEDKIVIGEWGFKHDVPSEVDWAKRFIAYLKKRNITNTMYWTIAHSHDTGNLYNDNCEYIHWDNLAILRTLWTDGRRYLRTGNNCSDCFGPIIFTNKNNNKT